MSNRKLCITAGGGLGDQVCAEPILRYMKEHWCKDDDIAVMTQYPFLYKHLDVTCYDQPVNFPEPRMSVATHPWRDEEDSICFHQMHTVDYISLRLLRRQLPLEARTVKLSISLEAQKKIDEIVGDPKKAVILHPGVSWASKNLPLACWQGYLDSLLDAGFKTIVAGKNFIANNTDYAIRGAYQLQGGLNLVDKLNLEEFCALLNHVPILITNDSAPVHLAGAFDNWIGLIATCRAPSYLFPYRHGSQFYKTCSLERTPIYDLFNFDPLSFLHWPIGEATQESLREAAPKNEDIITFVTEQLN